jgi:hypothetical protein
MNPVNMHDSARDDDRRGPHGPRVPTATGGYNSPTTTYGASLLMRLTSPGTILPDLPAADVSPRTRSVNFTSDLPPIPFLDR